MSTTMAPHTHTHTHTHTTSIRKAMTESHESTNSSVTSNPHLKTHLRCLPLNPTLIPSTNSPLEQVIIEKLDKDHSNEGTRSLINRTSDILRSETGSLLFKKVNVHSCESKEGGESIRSHNSANVNDQGDDTQCPNSAGSTRNVQLQEREGEIEGLGANGGGAGLRRLLYRHCLLYTSPSPRDATLSRMPSSA